MDNSIVTIKTNEEMHSDFEKTMIRMVNAHSDEMRKKHQIEEAEKRVMRVERNYKKMQQKKMERRQKFFKLFKGIICTIFSVFALWIFVSWVIVILHNTDPNGYQFSWNWNFFKIFF